MRLTHTLRLTALALALAAGLGARADYQPTPENLQAREDFADQKFGIFLHWGIYATFAQGEWYLETGKLNKDEYAKAASAFYPHLFNADEWISAFKDAGARYITFTSRHHDGFSMYKTATSNYNIVDATPFGRDVVGELSKACERQGINMHLYYSQLDWIREDYPIGRTGRNTGRKGDHQDYAHYVQFMKTQLGELLRNYKVGCIWFDGYWDKADFDWNMPDIYRYIHGIAPACLIGNNHHRNSIEGEDIQLFERDQPGQNTAGYSGDMEVSTQLPLEMCQTMNGMWGYKVADQNYKSVPQLVRLLVECASKGSNLLLNIGPQPNGQLPAAALERLKGMGQFLKTYGKSIYATRRGLVPEQPWGVSTTAKDGRTLYVHFLSPDSVQGGQVSFPLARKAVRATMLVGGQPVALKWKKGQATLSGLNLPKDNVDTVVAIELKK